MAGDRGTEHPATQPLGRAALPFFNPTEVLGLRVLFSGRLIASGERGCRLRLEKMYENVLSGLTTVISEAHYGSITGR